jgi:hypothetical protein
VQFAYRAGAAVNVEYGASSIVTFADDWASRNTPEPAAAIRADAEWHEYCRARELAERKAAKSARSLQARRVHQELAQAYMQLRATGR